MLYRYHFPSKKKDPRTCVCQNPECKTIALAFQNLEDVRGKYVTFPKILAEKDTRKATAIRQEHRFNRSRFHLGNLPRDKCLSIDNRNRSNAAKSARKTRSRAEQEAASPKQKKVFVANWHFHPKIFFDHMWDNRKQTAKSLASGYTIPLDYFSDPAFFTDSGYENCDRYPSSGDAKREGFPVLPTYTSARAWSDLEGTKDVINEEANRSPGSDQEEGALTPDETVAVEQLTTMRSILKGGHGCRNKVWKEHLRQWNLKLSKTREHSKRTKIISDCIKTWHAKGGYIRDQNGVELDESKAFPLVNRQLRNSNYAMKKKNAGETIKKRTTNRQTSSRNNQSNAKHPPRTAELKEMKKTSAMMPSEMRESKR